MKKQIKKLIAMTCVLACASSTLVGCQGAFRTSQMKIDENKTQLYVGNYDGGMGSRWLDEYKKGFEEMYKDESFESGKKGVEVIVLNDKVTYEAGNLRSTMDRSSVNVFFTERMDYYDFVDAGLLMDISDAVTTTIPGENKTIGDKLTDVQKGHYEVDGKYYGLPHYRSFRGIIYDRDLFNIKKLYIKKDGSVTGKEGDTDLSHGPDGEYGTYDDGFPATYDEFFSWCNNVKDIVTPIVWNGANAQSYSGHLLEALFVDASGADGAYAYYNTPVEGVETKIVSGFDANGKPVVEAATISRDNYKLSEQVVGNYYSLEFWDRLVKGEYYYHLSYNGTFTHTEAQYDFLHSRFDAEGKPIALMVEGTWWEEEANDVFEDMANNFEGAARSERNFGFLPLPKPTADFFGPSTLYDGNSSIVVVNANCDAVKADLAKKFLQYVTMDESLQLFNTITNIGRDYQYVLTDAQQEQLSPFGRDVYDMTQSSTGIVYGYPLTKGDYLWKKTIELDRLKTTVNGQSQTAPVHAFRNEGITARNYFEGIIAKNKK